MAAPGSERLTVPVVRPRALVVDSQPSEGRRIALRLESEGFVVQLVADTERAARHIEDGGVDALITEARTSRIDGLRLLHLARLRNPHVSVVFLITPREIELATRAMEDGVQDFQARPLNLPKLVAVVRRGLEIQRLATRVVEMQKRLDREFGAEGLIGESPAVTSVWRKVRQVAAGSASVVLVGEAGTGKGRLARAIHEHSARGDRPYVVVDCAKIPSPQLLVEWVGRTASSVDPQSPPARIGAFQRAAGGTLVLESVQSLDADAQSHLLGILIEGARPLSATQGWAAERPVPIDVRLIATTQRDLRDLVNAGGFREELFYRLNVVTLFLPPLRQRPQDIPLLLGHFLETSVEGTDLPVPGLTARALQRLCRHAWPGNVRELKDVVGSMLVGWDGTRLLDLEDLPASLQRARTEESGIWVSSESSMEELERKAIEAALAAAKFDRRVAARRLGISLRTFYRRLREYDIRAPRSDGPGQRRRRVRGAHRPMDPGGPPSSRSNLKH
ncbi:MAG: sigma-54 dependent transcriptional regulator [Candidatus Eisenbacteria bacterium]